MHEVKHIASSREYAFYFFEIQCMFCLHIQNGFGFLTKFLHPDQRFSRRMFKAP